MRMGYGNAAETYLAIARVLRAVHEPLELLAISLQPSCGRVGGLKVRDVAPVDLEHRQPPAVPYATLS